MDGPDDEFPTLSADGLLGDSRRPESGGSSLEIAAPQGTTPPMTELAILLVHGYPLHFQAGDHGDQS